MGVDMTVSGQCKKGSITVQSHGTRFRWLLFITGTMVILSREPLFFLEPRFWAEEGTRYYAYAYHYSQGPLWYKGILNVQRGYFSLWPNMASTVAANLVPVERAPLVTTLMAFLIQLIPLGLIAWSASEFWASPGQKAAGMLICLLTPLSGEIWLNTINSQFYLALVTILVLIEPAENGWRRKWAYRVLLALAGSTGLVCVILMPVYAFLAWLAKERERVIQAVILGVCAALQVGLLAGSSVSDSSVRMRLTDGRLYLLPFSLWTQSIGLVLGGRGWMAKLASRIVSVYEEGSIALVAMWIALTIVAVLLFRWLSLRLPLHERVILLGSYGLVLGLSHIGSLAENKIALLIPGTGARYYWVPNVVFGFLLIANVSRGTDGKFRSWLCAMMLAIMLVLGGIGYRATLMANRGWPQWRSEIELWRADPAHAIEVWPPGWKVILRR